MGIDRELVIKQVRKKMAILVEEMGYENLDETQRMFNYFLDFARDIYLIPSEVKEEIKPPETFGETSEEQDDRIESDEVVEYDSYLPPEIMASSYLSKTTDLGSVVGQIFEFKRRVSGGFIPALGDYRLNERVVREMNFENGDYLKVVKQWEDNGENKYRFEINEKRNTPVPGRIEYSLCTIEKLDGKLIVQRNSNGNININGKELLFEIGERAISKIQLEEGDIVDIAFYENSPVESMKVIYKHQTELVKNDNKALSESTKIIVKEKKKNYELNNYYSQIEVEKFKNLKVCLVGGMTRHAEFRDVLGKIGASLEQLNGEENHSRIESAISRADVVGIIYKECSHSASICAVDASKKLNIPYDATNNTGIQSMLLCLQSAMSKNNDDMKEVLSG